MPGAAPGRPQRAAHPLHWAHARRLEAQGIAREDGGPGPGALGLVVDAVIGEGHVPEGPREARLLDAAVELGRRLERRSSAHPPVCPRPPRDAWYARGSRRGSTTPPARRGRASRRCPAGRWSSSTTSRACDHRLATPCRSAEQMVRGEPRHEVRIRMLAGCAPPPPHRGAPAPRCGSARAPRRRRRARATRRAPSSPVAGRASSRCRAEPRARRCPRDEQLAEQPPAHRLPIRWPWRLPLAAPRADRRARTESRRTRPARGPWQPRPARQTTARGRRRRIRRA